MKHSFAKRLLVLMMAALMLLSVSPIGALAEELDDDTPVLETVEQPVEESEEEPEEESTDQSSEESTEESTEEPAEEPAEESEETTGKVTEESAEAVPLALEGKGEEPATATSVTVTFAASQDTFFFAPALLTVKAGIAKEYGYHNAEGVTGPTFLDALVAAHIQKYGDSFKTKPTDYLVCSAGSLSKVFGISTYNIACLVNGRMPGNAALMANQAEIKSGDVVQLLIYQYYDFDYETYEITCDDYCTFTEHTKTVAAGESFTLTLTGHSLATEMWGNPVTDEPLAEAYVSVCPVNADGSLGAQIADATADENGQITLSIGTAGEYLLTASGMTAEEKPLALPWCRVKVGNAATLSFWSGTGASAVEYTMTPKFSPSTMEYTVTVPDNTATLCIKATPTDDSLKTTVAYTKTNGAAYSAGLISGKTTSLSQTIKTGVATGNAIDLTMDGKSYTVNIVREATLSKLEMKDGDTALALTPAFKASDNTLRSFELLFAGSDLTVSASAKVAGNTIEVDSTPLADGKAVVSPKWVNHEYSFDIVIHSADNGSVGKYSIKLLQTPAALTVKTPPAKTEYKVGETLDLTGMTLAATYADGGEEILTADDFELISGVYVAAEEAFAVSYRGLTAEQPITISDKLAGNGTESDPYVLATAADLTQLSQMTAHGESFDGKFFKITDNITLPTDWEPIGCTKDGTNDIKKGENLNAFSGSIDGNGKTLTVPSGGKPLLGYVVNAAVKNLNIYGEKIAGYGLVNNFEGVGLSGSAIVIDNVTLKSGTQTQKAGLLGANITTNAYAGVSATFTATIRNCTIEEGVVIGYDGDQDHIGSFAGRFLGTIENCVSHATVKGTDYVGGILGTRDNSIGTCSVSGCTFDGTVEASGSYAGGIAGAMYVGAWGSNAYRIDIQNCSVTGKVAGKENVGGILGGDGTVYQNWYTAEFTGNAFSGMVSGEKNVGAIIGFYRSLDKYDHISGNTYSDDCGAVSGFGLVEYVDTNYAAPAAVEGTTYVNSEGAKPSVSGMTKKDCNRTDDPLGADASTLWNETESSSTAAKRDAAAVEALIGAIGEPEDVTKDSKAAIEAARKAYDALSAEAKALVTNYAKLTAAERKLAALDPQGSTKAIGTGDTRLVLDGVTYMVDAEAASLMQRIANLRDAGGTDDEGILSAYRTYDAMSSDLKVQVFNFADLEAMCDALGVRAHRDSLSGFAAEGLPWYVGLEISAITSGADYEIVAGSIGHNALLSLWHIEFINRLTGGRFTPYDSVTLRVAAPEMSEGLEQFRMALYADGRVAYSDCTVADGELVFSVTEGGVYGFIGGTAAATETLVVEDEPVEEAVVEAAKPEAELTPEAIEPVARPEAESGHTLLWLWIVIGVAGVAALVVVVVLKRQDRKARHSVK